MNYGFQEKLWERYSNLLKTNKKEAEVNLALLKTWVSSDELLKIQAEITAQSIVGKDKTTDAFVNIVAKEMRNAAKKVVFRAEKPFAYSMQSVMKMLVNAVLILCLVWLGLLVFSRYIGCPIIELVGAGKCSSQFQFNYDDDPRLIPNGGEFFPK